jgi:hypothetical protein
MAAGAAAALFSTRLAETAARFYKVGGTAGSCAEIHLVDGKGLGVSCAPEAPRRRPSRSREVFVTKKKGDIAARGMRGAWALRLSMGATAFDGFEIDLSAPPCPFDPSKSIPFSAS